MCKLPWTLPHEEHREVYEVREGGGTYLTIIRQKATNPAIKGSSMEGRELLRR
jgi:hypothetical protein